MAAWLLSGQPTRFFSLLVAANKLDDVALSLLHVQKKRAREQNKKKGTLFLSDLAPLVVIFSKDFPEVEAREDLKRP